MSISNDQALKALAAGVAKAEELGAKVAIAIVDEHADLVASIRMSDVNYLFLPQAAQGKAMASVVWKSASGALTERAATPMLVATNNIYHGALVYQQGAVTFSRDGSVVGAVGAGGASSQQDEDISNAVVEVLEA